MGTTIQPPPTTMLENKLNKKEKKKTLVGLIGISTRIAQSQSRTTKNVRKKTPSSPLAPLIHLMVNKLSFGGGFYNFHFILFLLKLFD
jgi:hypothetical protein